ncbi:hypothetical protein BDB01DRAFT_836751 [Pilobolus umbonatus]|nr:hypothetical protein BDB01DRAFT_836751 [Pilobolus umbonatus]
MIQVMHPFCHGSFILRYLLSDLHQQDYVLGQLLLVSVRRSVLLRKIISEFLSSENSIPANLQLPFNIIHWIHKQIKLLAKCHAALGKPEFLSSKMAMWTALVTLTTIKNGHRSPEDPAIFGCAFSTFWKY